MKNTQKIVEDAVSKSLGLQQGQGVIRFTLGELGADSLDIVDIVVEVERKLGVVIPNRDVARFSESSIDQIVKLIEEL